MPKLKLKENSLIPVVIVGRRRGSVCSFIAQASRQNFGYLTFCVPNIFGGGEFQERFIEPGSGVLLLDVISQWVSLIYV